MVAEDSSVPLLIHVRSDETDWLQEPRRLKRKAIMKEVSNAEGMDMVLFLTREVDKVSKFYFSQGKRLLQSFDEYKESQEEQSHLIALGHEILELKWFCVINVVTVRQIQIRYNAFARHFEGTPMLNHYLKQGKSQKSNSFRKILYHSELKTLIDQYLVLCRVNHALSVAFQLRLHELQKTVVSSGQVEAAVSAGSVALGDRLIQAFRYYSCLQSIEDRIGYQPTYLMSRGETLKQEMQIIAEWREHGYKDFLQPTRVNIFELVAIVTLFVIFISRPGESLV